MITVALLSTLLVLCLISWFLTLWDYFKLKVPGPFPLPLIGNGLEFAVDSQKFISVMKKISDRYGSVCSIYLLSFRYFLVSDPKLMEGLLSSTEYINKGRSYNFLKPWLGYGLLTADGQRWKTHRKFLTPSLHFNILQNFLPVFCKNEKILVNKLKVLADGRRTIDLFPIIALAALDNVTESIMGLDMNIQTDTESEYVKAIETISMITSSRMRNSFLSIDLIFNLTSLKKQQDEALKVLHGQTMKVIDARRQELQRLNICIKDVSELGIKNKHAFLDLLLLAEINGSKIDDEHIREEVDTFMFEGHDTTAAGITFALFCLSKHKDIQDKIYKEQERILGDEVRRDPTFSELQQMKYLEMVIKESLRLYPSVPLIERKITQDSDIAGIRVPADTSIVVNIFQMQRNPEVFEDPLDFKPERFDSSVQRNAFHWLPFSAGPRNCIGQKFAMIEMKITIAGIIKQFHVLPSGVEPDLAAELILRSQNGVNVKLLPRESQRKSA